MCRNLNCNLNTILIIVEMKIMISVVTDLWYDKSPSTVTRWWVVSDGAGCRWDILASCWLVCSWSIMMMMMMLKVMTMILMMIFDQDHHIVNNLSSFYSDDHHRKQKFEWWEIFTSPILASHNYSLTRWSKGQSLLRSCHGRGKLEQFNAIFWNFLFVNVLNIAIASPSTHRAVRGSVSD